MSAIDLLLVRFVLASVGCLAAGLIVWVLARQLCRLPGFQLQRSTWLLAQVTIVAAFLVIAMPHSEQLRIVPPIELDSQTMVDAPVAATSQDPSGAPRVASAPDRPAPSPSLLVYAARGWMALYLMGITWAMLRLLQARRLLTGLASAGQQLSRSEQHPELARAAPELQVIEVDAPISPMLFGLLRPRLLLPRHLRSFDAVQQHMIVEHELTHLRRHDLHWMSAGLLLQTVLWFNPFMRLLRVQLSWAQELGCDRDVLAGQPMPQRKAYAAALLAQLKAQHRPVPAALAFGGVSANTVAARIALIREPAKAVRSRLARIAAACALALAFAGSLALQPALAWRADPAASPIQLAAQAGAGPELSCTMLVDAATGERLVHEGQCDARVTPASTFNIVVSLMGFDSGILVNELAPALPFKPGYVNWNPAWRTTIDPSSWIRHSVVWYAQQVAARLGAERFQRYVEQFNYGNRDVTGDPGKDNGLELSWINSSLKISPAEQVNFLRAVVNRHLPVSARAYLMTERVLLAETVDNGWKVHGKTGTANPLLPNGKDDESRQYGWYVGWASKGERKVVFARLMLDKRQQDGAAGPRLKRAFLRELPARLDGPG